VSDAAVKVKEGDWVRFYRNGALVIGVVQYVRNRDTYPRWEKQAMTDVGAVDLGSILESRRAPSGDGGDV
jgi:hypothetical protein